LDKDAVETINVVLYTLGDKDAQYLSTLTHREDPWKNARIGLDAGERGSNEITLASMSEYYSGLDVDIEGLRD
jgi:uncharacterized phage-associated protein